MMSLLPKALLDPNNEETLTRQQARTFLIVNVIAVPGVGTIMAGRRIGWAQMFLVLAGVLMMLSFAAIYFKAIVGIATDMLSTEADFWTTIRRNAWIGITGFILSGFAWCWSLVSGLSILRGAKQRESKPPPIPIEH